MKISPKDIARSLVDSLASSETLSIDDACDSAIALLKSSCPGVPLRKFIEIVEREVRRKGLSMSAMLVVPSEHSLSSAVIAPLLEAKAGKKVHVDRMVEPELIGGAVLLMEHRRIDCTIQGALATLLRSCLQPLES